MKKIVIFLVSLLYLSNAYAAAPSSTYTYINGTAINPNQVQTNENNIYSYLQAGVDTYKPGSITNAAISSTAGILYSQLNLSNGILPADINTSTTTNIYQFGSITVPNSVAFQGTISVSGSTGTLGASLISQGALAPVFGSSPYVKLTNTQSSGVNGGTSVSGSWQTIPLNTKDQDAYNIATLSTSTIIIPAGTYQVHGSALFVNANNPTEAQLRLLNSTDSAVLITGSNSPAVQMNNDTQSYIAGQFTITATKTIILQYQCSSAEMTSGLGNAFGFGPEVYDVLELWKIS